MKPKIEWQPFKKLKEKKYTKKELKEFKKLCQKNWLEMIYESAMNI